MKKKGFIFAIAAIVTFILVIIICSAVAAKQKSTEKPNPKQAAITTVVRETPIHAWED